MTPHLLDRLVIRPTLEWLGPAFQTPGRRVLLLAIALQESGLRDRFQLDDDGRPILNLGRSYWQFERGTVGLVLAHERCVWLSYKLQELSYLPHAVEIHEVMAHNDNVACAMAASLLWSDLQRLPGIGDEAGAWRCYIRNWNPGKPRPREWPENYSLAVGTVLNESEQYLA